MIKKYFFILCFIFLILFKIEAQNQTVGLFLNDERSFNGYTLFAPNYYTVTYLIDNWGRVVNTWESDYAPGHSVYLLEDGRILRSADDKRVQVIEWDGTVVWNYRFFSNNQYERHHDVEMLPNGNVLILAKELKTESEAIAAGRNPALLSDGELWPDFIVEVEPEGATGGNIVWQWHFWDHLIQDYDSSKNNYGVISEHPELLDINFTRNSTWDWLHSNAVNYNEELDQIIISTRFMNEIHVIDHSTTTEEATGHTGGNHNRGGDFLYRWGNPRVYDRGDSDDQKFFLQHDAQWIKPSLPGEGNILVFNNGNDRPGGNYSSIDEIVPPVDSTGSYYISSDSAYRPLEQTWIYTTENKTDFYSHAISGAQRLPNGNTLICSGMKGVFFEVTAKKEIVWKYINPVTKNGPLSQGDAVPSGGYSNQVFRCYRYAPDYPGLMDKDLTPGDPVELDPTNIINKTYSGKNISLQRFPSPSGLKIKVFFNNKDKHKRVTIFSINGKEIFKKSTKQNYITWNAANQPCGIYIVKVNGEVFSKYISLIR